MIVWIVSYPKSGNTLVRSMLSALISSKLHGTDGSIDLKRLSLIPQFPTYNYFKESVPENALTDIEKLCKYWIKIQKEKIFPIFLMFSTILLLYYSLQ